ncbi:RagB/SusD family nutrient uptake outer membrane protein [Sphingobacterium chungjuense]|uniref:RagB/SusD family nutrient uptake outer membrane protein n=1 Tax=Sphingobacterium chungjuense TaxID=2675553 RepID=UPI0014073BEA|nr:RagB/SusD family nutrient uptake outer membrane protein [Sphingobacterium chungjuense]
MDLIKKVTIAAICTISYFLISCSNLLDIRDTDYIGGENALRTVQDTESLLIAAYAALQDRAVPLPVPETVTDYEMNIRYNGILSDELKTAEFSSLNTMHEWTFAFDDVGLRGNFMPNVTYYRVIDRVNRVLFALPNVIAEAQTDEARRQLIRGEALFLRAFSHFELFRCFCRNYDPNGLGMPYLDQPQFNPQELHARINMGEYFAGIISDLEEAKDLVANNLNNKARTNRVTVSALQARIALYMRNWDQAVVYSTEYINALPLANRERFIDIWTDQNTDEVSWQLTRTTANRVGNFLRSISSTSAGQAVLGTLTWVPSDKLWNAYDPLNDIRFEAYFIDEPLLSRENRYSRILRKYNGSGYATTNENVAHIKVFRTAEMYLIRAESSAELGDLANASADLNSLRIARIINFSPVSLSSREHAIDEILLERFKELALEGHRFWDLKRRSMPVTRLDSDAPQTTSRILPADNFRFVLPIPRWEMEANILMEQNEGYASN